MPEIDLGLLPARARVASPLGGVGLLATRTPFQTDRRGQAVSITLHHDDLPANMTFKGSVAIDTETMGLKLHRDRLCLVQLSAGDGKAHLVQMKPGAKAPRLRALIADPGVLKIFHYARFDMAVLKQSIGAMPSPVYCTKIASKIARTYTDRHGLKDLVKDVLGVEVSKEQQSWTGAPTGFPKSSFPTRRRTFCTFIGSESGSALRIARSDSTAIGSPNCSPINPLMKRPPRISPRASRRRKPLSSSRQRGITVSRASRSRKTMP